jgi:hypothetical protein
MWILTFRNTQWDGHDLGGGLGFSGAETRKNRVGASVANYFHGEVTRLRASIGYRHTLLR